MISKRSRLKVFEATIGFSDVAIASPSRKAALDALGVRQDLFQEKLAWESRDPSVREAALAHPLNVLSRPTGSGEPFTPASERAPPQPQSRRAAPGRRTPSARAVSPSEREDLRRADEEIADLEARLRAETERYERALETLSRERDERLTGLSTRLEAARAARRRSGDP